MPTILLVEDDLLNVDLARRVLRRRPHVELVAAGTGADALALVAEQPPSLVLLDMHLPDLSGLEILARLRADPATAQLPIVVLSGDSSSGPALAAGASDYLAKPYDVAQLLAVIDRFVPPETGEPGAPPT
jgi:CheY-like chemotaxis protein